jgi:simple sugar transport system substrate-binding protein
MVTADSNSRTNLEGMKDFLTSAVRPRILRRKFGMGRRAMDAPGGRDARPHRLIVATHDLLGDPFWASLLAGVHDAAAHTGCTIEHLRPERYSTRAMRDTLARALAAAPDGLLTTLPDPEALDAPLRAAIQSGLPTILLNTLDRRPAGSRLPVLCSIGADDRLAGEMAADHLLADDRCRHALCVDHYHVRNTCHSERIEGFRHRLHEAGRTVTVLRLDAAAKDGMRLVGGALDAAVPAFDSVLTLGPPGRRCVEAVLAARPDVGRLRHVSFDLTADVLDAIHEGRVLGVIDCQQYLQGYLGVAAMDRYLAYGVVPCGEVFTGPRFVHAGNMARLGERVRAGAG